MSIQHDLVQGSPEWHQFRLEHFGASEAAAMLGLSKHLTRNELLRMKHTGVAREFSEWFQTNILDNGHAVEAAARPLAEAIIGEELYPATYSEGRLSASCDGLTMDGFTAFEHKQWSTELAETIRARSLPDEYEPQCQQVMMVTGAKRVLFMVSDGMPEKCVYMWVAPSNEWRKNIMQGWSQFSEDLANYQHVEEAPSPVASAIESLPALLVQVEGRVLATNLDQFKQKALTFIGNIKTELSTDQDFADADKTAKFLKDGEDKLELVKEQALSQTASIDELFRAIDHIREEMRATRLRLEKSVDTQKKSIRAKIQEGGEAAMRAHINALNKRLGKPYMPGQKWADFMGVMKGKKTITSLRDAIDTELARAKIATNEIADRIQINLNSLRELASDHAFLFADTAQIVLKANDDLVALIKTRIADHKAAESEKAERQQREREEARVRQAAETSAVPLPAAPPSAVPQGRAASAKTRPTDQQIIEVLALHYHVHEYIVVGWLRDMDLVAAMAPKEKRGIASR